MIPFLCGCFVGACATVSAVWLVSTLEDDPNDPHTLAATQEALDNERAINERLELRIAELEQPEGPAN